MPQLLTSEQDATITQAGLFGVQASEAMPKLLQYIPRLQRDLEAIMASGTALILADKSGDEAMLTAAATTLKAQIRTIRPRLAVLALVAGAPALLESLETVAVALAPDPPVETP
jgi:hypothetical protein